MPFLTTEQFKKKIRDGESMGIARDVTYQTLKTKGYQIQGEPDGESGFMDRLRAAKPDLSVAKQNLMDAPGQFADFGKQALPIAGSIVGSGVGGVLGAAGGPIGVAAGFVGGAAAGRAIGQTGTEFIEGLQGEEQGASGRVKDVALGGARGAVEGAVDAALPVVGRAAGKVAGKVGSKLMSPFSSRYLPEIEALATKKGITLPVSSVSDSNAVKILEATAQKGIMGGNVERQVETATKQLSGMADDLVKKFGGSDDFTVAGKSVIEGADAFRDVWRQTKNKAYETAKTLLKSGDSGAFKPNTSKTVAVIDEILGGKEASTQLLGDTPLSSTTSGLLQELRSNLLSQKSVSLEAYTNAINELNQMTKFGNTLVSTGDQAVLKKVIATMDQDVTEGIRAIAPKAAAALDKADSIYKSGIELLDSSFGTKIAKLSDNPTKIVDQLITPKSVDDIPKIFELIGKGKNGAERIADVQSAFARKLVEGGKNADGVIGQQLDKAIDRYGESTVSAVLGDDGLQALREISKLGTAINRGQSVAKGSQTAFVSKVTAFITAIGTLNLPLAASIAGGDVTLSGLFKTQWFRNWLTKGLQGPVLPDAVGELGKSAIQGASKIIPRMVGQ